MLFLLQESNYNESEHENNMSSMSMFEGRYFNIFIVISLKPLFIYLMQSDWQMSLTLQSPKLNKKYRIYKKEIRELKVQESNCSDKNQLKSGERIYTYLTHVCRLLQSVEEPEN